MEQDRWFYVAEGQRVGPLALDGLVEALLSFVTPGGVLVWREGMGEWVPAARVDEISAKLPPPVPDAGTDAARRGRPPDPVRPDASARTPSALKSRPTAKSAEVKAASRTFDGTDWVLLLLGLACGFGVAMSRPEESSGPFGFLSWFYFASTLVGGFLVTLSRLIRGRHRAALHAAGTVALLIFIYMLIGIVAGRIAYSRRQSLVASPDAEASPIVAPPQQNQSAFEDRLAAAEAGNVDAQVSVAFAYDKGAAVDANTAEAARWFRRAAERGHAGAQNQLGYAYREGRGVSKDPGIAVVWFRKAAEQGNAAAQNNLAWAYDNGEGVEKNALDAVRWYQMAAEQGDATGLNNLGWAYQHGQGIGKNPLEAVRLYEKAAKRYCQVLWIEDRRAA